MKKKMVVMALSGMFVVSSVLMTPSVEAWSLKKPLKKWAGKAGEVAEKVGDAVRNNKGLIGSALVLSMTDSKRLNNVAKLLIVGAIAKAVVEESSRNRMARSTQKSLVTGKSSKWEDPKTGNKGTTTVKNKKVRKKEVEAKYRKDKIAELPPLEYMAGGQYVALSDAPVMPSPDDKHKKNSVIKKGETVDICAKVEGKPWYMVSTDGVASGFVKASLLNFTGIPVDITKKSKSSDNIAVANITAKQQCVTIEQQVTTKDGKTHTEAGESCQNSDGSWSMT